MCEIGDGWISRLVMPMRYDGRGMDGSESKRSKDSPVPWPTSAHVSIYSTMDEGDIPRIVSPSFRSAADIKFKASATQE